MGKKEKPRVHLGEFINLENVGVGVSCAKGKKPSIANQDSWFVARFQQFSMYCVLDGHGPEGHHVSHFVKDNLPKLILRDKRVRAGRQEIKSMLRDSFHVMQALVRKAHHLKYFDASLSGTTVTLAIHDHENEDVWVAWLGDSQACIGAQKLKSPKLGHRIRTWDHKPSLPGETERITASGGEVIPGNTTSSLRVHVKGQRYPGLNMSRCLGSLIGHDRAGLSCEPTILNHQLEAIDKVLLLCSDGVWQFISIGAALDNIKGTTSQNCSQQVEKLLEAAWKEWSRDSCGFIDDITILLAVLQ